jgi:hypothetical protein
MDVYEILLICVPILFFISVGFVIFSFIRKRRIEAEPKPNHVVNNFQLV